MTPDPWTRILRRLALTGVVLLAAALTPYLPMWAAEVLVAYAAITIVPLGLALVIQRAPAEPRPVVDRAAAMAVLPGACAVIASYTYRPGAAAAVLAGAWVVACGIIGALGVARAARRWRRGALFTADEVCIDVGLLYLPVGAVWLALSRGGATPLGFREPVILLTAAHFHYAGFGAPLVCGLVGRLVHEPGERTSFEYRVAAVAVCAGVPLTAVGILTSHGTEATSALLLAAGMLALAALLFLRATRAALALRPGWRGRAAAALFALAGLSLVVSMAFAATFAVTGSAGRDASDDPLFSITRMVEVHGVANALGFTTACLLAFTLLEPPERRRAQPGDR